MKLLKIVMIVLFTTVFFMPFVSMADSLDSILEKAQNTFWNGDYQKAIALYGRLEELGVQGPNLAYNQGTAYARLGKWGQAVRYYERALRIEPGHADARYNLGAMRDFLARRASEAGRDADLAPAVTPWRAVLDRFSTRGAAYIFLVFHIALFLVLIIRRFVQGELPRLFLGVCAGLFAILTVLMLSVSIGKWNQDDNSNEAVVIAGGQLAVMEGPSSAVKRFGLEEGSRVLVLEEKGGWSRLSDNENRDGWVKSTEIGKI